ncbi:hypothetical protein [Camelliibacillus cellulosilyticus]|uniref:hypothetical protein n=1 Tax=Camelliibacillus cellulosilyticus TaxID=2174486 RepID=UPI00366B1E05
MEVLIDQMKAGIVQFGTDIVHFNTDIVQSNAFIIQYCLGCAGRLYRPAKQSPPPISLKNLHWI